MVVGGGFEQKVTSSGSTSPRLNLLQERKKTVRIILEAMGQEQMSTRQTIASITF